jgi:alpha-glucosidase
MRVGPLRATVLLWLAFGSGAWAQKSAVDEEGHPWWKHAVFYEIYPSSFADSNNDGIGNIPGITSKLDYLHWLGVDAIWIAPMYPSPQVDWGHHISDYYSVNPDYGTMKDMDALVTEGKRRNNR